MAAALLLAFIVSCNYRRPIPRIFAPPEGRSTHRRADRRPLTTDEFSYTEAGQPLGGCPLAVPVVACGALQRRLRPGPRRSRRTRRPTAARPTRSRSGRSGFLDALVRLATAWMLLKIRHRGPGLWWSAICVTLALGVFYHPLIGLHRAAWRRCPGSACDHGILPHVGPALPGPRAVDPVPGLRSGTAALPLVADPPVLALGQLGYLVPDGLWSCSPRSSSATGSMAAPRRGSDRPRPG